MQNTETLPIPHNTLSELIGQYRQAVMGIASAFNQMKAVEAGLKASFGDCQGTDLSYVMRYNHAAFDDRGEKAMIDKLKRDVWKLIVDKMQIRRVLSVRAAKELDEQLEKGEMGELTEDWVLAMMRGTASKVDQYLAEAIREAYDFIRPRSAWGSDRELKTNEKNRWELGEKVILSGWVSHYGGVGPLGPSHYRQKEITALDNAFHALDEDRAVMTNHGPLYDALHKSGPAKFCETKYFRCKLYQNGNLHVEFKRADLVAKFNAIAGGARLKYEKPD